jgi:hypothetical protein
MTIHFDELSYQQKKFYDEMESLTALDIDAICAQPLEAHTHPLALQWIEKIPLLKKFLQEPSLMANALTNLFEVKENTTGALSHLAKAGDGFHFFKLGISLLDLVKIPLLYIVSRSLGVPLPFKLSNLGKFVYAAIVTGLVLTSIIVPPLGGLVWIGLGVSCFVMSLSVLVKQLIKNRQLTTTMNALEAKEIALKVVLKKNQDDLAESMVVLKSLQDNYLDNEVYLSAAKEDAILQHKKDRKQCMQKILTLRTLIHTAKADLVNTLTEKSKTDAILKDQTKGKMVKKSIALGLSCIGVIGAVLAFFLPPIGFGILFGTGLLGLGAFIVSYGAPFLKQKFNVLWQRVRSKEPDVMLADTVSKETSSVHPINANDSIMNEQKLPNHAPLSNAKTAVLDSTVLIESLIHHKEHAVEEDIILLKEKAALSEDEDNLAGHDAFVAGREKLKESRIANELPVNDNTPKQSGHDDDDNEGEGEGAGEHHEPRLTE